MIVGFDQPPPIRHGQIADTSDRHDTSQLMQMCQLLGHLAHVLDDVIADDYIEGMVWKRQRSARYQSEAELVVDNAAIHYVDGIDFIQIGASAKIVSDAARSAPDLENAESLALSAKAQQALDLLCLEAARTEIKDGVGACLVSHLVIRSEAASRGNAVIEQGRRSKPPRAPLLITRKFPPSVGGMQTLAAGVWRSLHGQAPQARLIAHTGSNLTLPIWLLTALPRAARAIVTGEVDGVITGDALMYALMRPLLVAAHLPNLSMIHGLDVTYQNRLYRAVVHPALRRARCLVTISGATAAEAQKVGVPSNRIAVIPPGVPAPEIGPAERQAAGADARRRLSIADGSVLLLTVGRLVRRKGVPWFLRAVMPRLSPQAVYLVAGAGPLDDEIRSLVTELGLSDRVRILGQVDDFERDQLLCAADIFVQPNVVVSGDMEGFGLVLIEASLRGTVSVASGIEGIVDAVVDRQTGFLVSTEDADAWVRQLNSLIAEPDQLAPIGTRFQAAARARYDEEQMGLRLMELLARSTSADTQ